MSRMNVLNFLEKKKEMEKNICREEELQHVATNLLLFIVTISEILESYLYNDAVAVNELSQRMCQFYAKIESRSFPSSIHACSLLSLLMENSCRVNLCNFHDGRGASCVTQKSMLQRTSV